MLQRAASNAYSWWWASHIRTKQSKWLEQNLQDMEAKVGAALKILHEEGDSFVRRAEMYYRQRPELIEFVEEAYRGYRSLAERYDHISTELQKANNTIASCFPDQVPFMDDDDDDDGGSPRAPRKMPEGPKANNPSKVPKPPESTPPRRDLKSVIKSATKKFSIKKAAAATKPKSGLSKQEARQEVDKLQKQILTLQTVKEFVKSSYDSSLARYWETEEQIKELQDKVSSLEDEVGEAIVIEDDEARQLMAEAALKSCQDALSQLQMKQEKSIGETKIESKRVKEARDKLESLMDEFNCNQSNRREPKAKKGFKKTKELDEDVDRMSDQTQELQAQELQLLREKIEVHFEDGASLSVTEMADKINELVNKVISLETAVSSQDALVNRLRTETDDLQSHIRTLEDDKASLINDKTDLNNKLREMEDKLQEVQDLNNIVQDQNTNLQSNLEHILDKVQDVKLDEKVEIKDLSQTERRLTGEAESEYGFEEQDTLKKDNSISSFNSGIKLLTKGFQVTGLVGGDVNSNEELQVTSLVEGDVKSNKDLRGIGLAEGDVKSNKELQVTDPVEGDVKSDKVLPVTGSIESHVISDIELQVRNLAKGDVNSNKELQVTGLIEGDVKSDKMLPATGSVEGDVMSDKELQVTGSAKGDVKSNKKLQVTGLVEGDVKSDKRLPVTGSVDGDVMSNKELQVTGSPERGVKLDNELKITSSLEKQDSSPLKSKSPKELKEQEKIVIPGNSDKQAKEDVTVSNTAGNQNVSQPRETSEANKFSGISGNHKRSSAVQISSEIENTLKLDSQQHVTAQEDEPDWRRLFMNGMEEREKVLLIEYTNALRSYKDVKKQFSELEKKSQDTLFDTSLKLKELKTENAMKNEEIRLLRHKLSLLQRSLEANEDLKEEMGSATAPEKEAEVPEKEDNIMAMFRVQQPATISATEERFRSSIDAILEENLDFWLNFSTTFTEIQKFESPITDLQCEVTKLVKKGKASESSSSIKYTAKSDARPIYKHLMEIHTELTVWLEKSVQLKDDLQNRFSSLCEIQEEITKALKDSAEDDDFQFTSYQAAKFQGEVLNMKTENNKIADELQAGLDHMTSLQLDVEKALGKLNDQFGFSSSKRQQEQQPNGQLRRSESRNTVPLRSFIFGVKPKKQKQSIFSCMTPAMHKKYRALKR
ncbi:hypothetical protein L6164_020512 [Bauhinia variegata]|uniref:Uncharacterized protein n=1 Tax=Bauhinia variegata TaxID=167791 RepID=A0ACB9MVS3_BAUVA|nr:hypothetical protein L6164_020512 [Bauhinia variegata]